MMKQFEDFLNSDFLGLGMTTTKVALLWILGIVIVFIILGFLFGGEGGYIRMNDTAYKWKLKKGSAVMHVDALVLAGYDYELHFNTDPRPQANFDEIVIKKITAADIVAIETIFGADLLDKANTETVSAGRIIV